MCINSVRHSNEALILLYTTAIHVHSRVFNLNCFLLPILVTHLSPSNADRVLKFSLKGLLKIRVLRPQPQTSAQLLGHLSVPKSYCYTWKVKVTLKASRYVSKRYIGEILNFLCFVRLKALFEFWFSSLLVVAKVSMGTKLREDMCVAGRVMELRRRHHEPNTGTRKQ